VLPSAVLAGRKAEPERPAPWRAATMKRSTERFLTTHTGSLPRADDLVRMIFAKDLISIASTWFRM
jgi:hypothetical protein